jgi:hypothetical protein
VVFGGATAAVVLLALLTTRMRPPHSFTPYMLYFHLAGCCFIHDVVTGRCTTQPVLRALGTYALVAAM